MPSIYEASPDDSLIANGKSVPVVGFDKEYDYATFGLGDGPCTLEMTRLDGKPVERHAITPMKLKLSSKAAGSKLSYTDTEPIYLIVQLHGVTRELVIAIDAPEADRPGPQGQGVFNVTSAPYSADATGATPATDAIQRAVDDAGKYSGGKNAVVYVPNGVYNLTELRLVSNVSLYLEPAAVLRCNGTRDDLKVRYFKRSQNRHGTWFIYTADGAANVRIFGRGTIDGNGRHLVDKVNLSNHVVVPMNCSHFTMDGPILRDSGLWGVVVGNSRDVALRNTKHFNHLDMGENDCVDICNSQDVTVRNSI